MRYNSSARPTTKVDCKCPGVDTPRRCLLETIAGAPTPGNNPVATIAGAPTPGKMLCVSVFVEHVPCWLLRVVLMFNICVLPSKNT